MNYKITLKIVKFFEKLIISEIKQYDINIEDNATCTQCM